MYAVVVREAGDASEISQSAEHLRQNVAPRVKQAPGFIAASWMTDGSGHTLNLLVFQTEDAARGALAAVERAPRPGYLTLESAEIYQVLASDEAARPGAGAIGR